ncbi:MAG: hypothetical protein K2P26_03430, partial [Oscillospiraceae bacterium]|nr:hypothetical protein [Oscillospiraceae bacterium]
MSQYEKLLLSVLSGTRDKNMLFTDLQTVLDRLGFQCRIKGDHFIYTKSLFNISPRPPWRHIFRPDCVKNPC